MLKRRGRSFVLLVLLVRWFKVLQCHWSWRRSLQPVGAKSVVAAF